MHIKEILNKSVFYLIIAFFVVLFFIALDRFDRWDLLEQIAMADNFIKHGSLYPDLNNPTPNHVSVYFPGISLIALFLLSIGIDGLIVETLLICASVIVVGFLYIQLKLASHLYKMSIDWREFAPSTIVYCLFITPSWLIYAVEFKADTIALSIGFLGLIYAQFLDSRATNKQLVLGGVICALGLIFKQQHIAFVLGIGLFILFFPEKRRFVFLGSLSITSLLIVSIFYLNKNLWFWNVNVLSDDSISSFFEIIEQNLAAMFWLFLLTTYFVYFTVQSKSKKILFHNYFSFVKKQIQIPWVWPVTFSILASIVSAAKVGGNAGNIELAFVLLLPVFYILTRHVDRSIFICLGWLGILIALPLTFKGVNNYGNASDMKMFVYEDSSNAVSSVVSGSNVYFASRHYSKDAEIFSHWSKAIQTNSTNFESLKDLISEVGPDRIIVENWSDNRSFINDNPHYELIFENSVGLIAKAVN